METGGAGSKATGNVKRTEWQSPRKAAIMAELLGREQLTCEGVRWHKNTATLHDLSHLSSAGWEDALATLCHLFPHSLANSSTITPTTWAYWVCHPFRKETEMIVAQQNEQNATSFCSSPLPPTSLSKWSQLSINLSLGWGGCLADWILQRCPQQYFSSHLSFYNMTLSFCHRCVWACDCFNQEDRRIDLCVASKVE